MSVDIVNSRLLVQQRQEEVILMDDYGNSLPVYIPVAAGSQREDVIARYKTQMETAEAEFESYAQAVGIDISADKEAGLAKKAAAKK
jgi:hypothetical protein